MDILEKIAMIKLLDDIENELKQQIVKKAAITDTLKEIVDYVKMQGRGAYNYILGKLGLRPQGPTPSLLQHLKNKGISFSDLDNLDRDQLLSLLNSNKIMRLLKQHPYLTGSAGGLGLYGLYSLYKKHQNSKKRKN